jgi:hypothetical protein
VTLDHFFAAVYRPLRRSGPAGQTLREARRCPGETAAFASWGRCHPIAALR